MEGHHFIHIKGPDACLLRVGVEGEQLGPSMPPRRDVYNSTWTEPGRNAAFVGTIEDAEDAKDEDLVEYLHGNHFFRASGANATPGRRESMQDVHVCLFVVSRIGG